MNTNEIQWKRVDEHTPCGFTGAPFVTCIVWVCNPDVIRGGLPDVVRWNVKNKCWHEPDTRGKWIHEDPYKITHFCDTYSIPESQDKRHG